jgi:hypothetical protein
MDSSSNKGNNKKKKRKRKDGNLGFKVETDIRALNIVKPSVMVNISNNNFVDEFTDLFNEHIKGFMQKRQQVQTDTEMEWKVRLKKKRKGQDSKGSKVKANAADRQKIIDAYRKLKKKKKNPFSSSSKVTFR